MTILRHVDIEPSEATAYLKHAAAMRAAATGEEEEAVTADGDEESVEDAALSAERIAELGGAEEFLLVVGNDGFGKRSSAYGFRVMNRGGQGVWAHDHKRGTTLSASFPVDDTDQIMAVTDGGQLIRFPVDTVRIASRGSRGVRLIRLNDSENVVAVVRIQDAQDDEDLPEDGEAGQAEGEGGDVSSEPPAASEEGGPTDT